MFLRSVFQRLAPVSHTRAAHRRRGAQMISHRRARQFEPLEDRRVLAVLYAANDSGFQITNDTGAPGLSAGDTMTWAGGGSAVPVAGLTFGTNAFDSINAAIAAAAAGDTVEVAPGTYTEGGVVIDKDLTLEGAGNVVLLAPHDGSDVGITLNGNPSNVTIADFTIKNFQSSLFANGVGNLNLTDLSLQANAGLYLPFSEIQNVQNLNLLDTSNTGGSVYVNPPSSEAPFASIPAGPPAEISFFSLEGFDISGVAHLSLQTGGGNDTFYVSPRSDTSISIDAGDPAPPATPGDKLNMNLYGITGANLSDTRDASGFSGTWTFTNAKPVSFSHIETVSPSSVMANGAGQAITATEGVSTGNVVVATFSDSASGLPLTDYSADINWGDGTSSTGTVSLDASSGVYSVSGSHTYAEDGSEQIAVIVHRTSAPDATLDATATVVEPPLVQLYLPVAAPLGHEGTAVTVDVGFFTHGNNTEPAGGFTATIDWGDGTTSTGQVNGGNGASYVVSGTHTYHDEGHYTVKSTLVDTSGGNTLALSTVVVMREALLPNGTEGTADERFVSEVYNDLLHRPVDANGLAYWSGKLAGGAPRAEVVAGIENTHEYRHVVVASLYETYLGRAADPAAIENGEALLAHGGTREQLASIIVGSDEYFHGHGGTNDGFLRALYEAALNRPIDAAAQTYAEQELASGATRAQVAQQIFGSHEYHVDVVQDLYLMALNRPADTGGATYFADQLDHGQTDDQVLASLMASEEYFDRVS